MDVTEIIALIELVKQEIGEHIEQENEVKTPLGQSKYLETLMVLKRSLVETKEGKFERFESLPKEDIEILVELVEREITKFAREGDPCAPLHSSVYFEKIVCLRRFLRVHIDSLTRFAEDVY